MEFIKSASQYVTKAGLWGHLWNRRPRTVGALLIFIRWGTPRRWKWAIIVFVYFCPFCYKMCLISNWATWNNHEYSLLEPKNSQAWFRMKLLTNTSSWCNFSLGWNIPFLQFVRWAKIWLMLLVVFCCFHTIPLPGPIQKTLAHTALCSMETRRICTQGVLLNRN